MSETLKTDSAEVLRTDFTGTIWFGSSLIATALPYSGLLASGWRPAQLPGDDQIIWWLGSVLVVVGIFGLAYAGCPVLGLPLPRERRLKDVAVQGGLIVFGIGTVVSALAVLLAPA